MLCELRTLFIVFIDILKIYFFIVEQGFVIGCIGKKATLSPPLMGDAYKVVLRGKIINKQEKFNTLFSQLKVLQRYQDIKDRAEPNRVAIKKCKIR